MSGRKDAEHAYSQGISLLKTGEAEQAVACLDQAIEHDPTFTKALQQRSFLLCLMGKPGRALEDCNRALAVDSDDAWSYLHRAMVHSKLQHFRAAVDDCTAAIRLEPMLLVAYTERGSALCELKLFDDAIADFSQAIELNPRDPVNFVCRAVAYDEIGKYRETIVDFSHAIDLNPEDPIGYFSRALAFHKIDDYPDALADYDRVLQLDPDFADARQNRQIAYDQIQGQLSLGCAGPAAIIAAEADEGEEPKRAKVYDIFTKAEIMSSE